jgi:hypothetical protein
MFGVFVAIVHVLLVLNASLRSTLERFVLGAAAGVLRVVLLGVVTVNAFKATFATTAATSPPPNPALLAALVVGPIVSFVVLVVAYRRMRDVPAALEDRASRVFKAWLGVGIIDAMYVVIALAANAISGP